MSSLSLQNGQTAQIDATVYRNAIPIASANTQMVWSVTGGIGTISKSGLFTATHAGTGTIQVSCYGMSKSIAVTVSGMGELQDITTIADFESSQPLTAQDGVSLSVTGNQSDVIARI